MELKQQFTVQHDVEAVWQALSDAPFAVQCLPGAELEPSNDDIHYRGKMKVKLGPLSTAFAGDAVVERDVDSRTGTVHWTGTDTRSNSRAKATMVYRLSPADNAKSTTVDITADVALTGALAQFGRSGIIQDVANRLTSIFADNLQQRLNETQGATLAPQSGASRASTSEPFVSPRPATAQELRAMPLLWGVMRTRLAQLLRRLANWVEDKTEQ